MGTFAMRVACSTIAGSRSEGVNWELISNEVLYRASVSPARRRAPTSNSTRLRAWAVLVAINVASRS